MKKRPTPQPMVMPSAASSGNSTELVLTTNTEKMAEIYPPSSAGAEKHAATTTPTLADFEAWVKSEEQHLLDAMDAAVAAEDADAYEALHTEFLESSAAYEALWRFKATMRHTPSTPANSAAQQG